MRGSATAAQLFVSVHRSTTMMRRRAAASRASCVLPAASGFTSLSAVPGMPSLARIVSAVFSRSGGTSR